MHLNRDHVSIVRNVQSVIFLHIQQVHEKNAHVIRTKFRKDYFVRKIQCSLAVRKDSGTVIVVW